MKKLLIVIALLILSLGSAQTYAQERAQDKEVIVVELLIGESEDARRTEVPINYGIKRTKERPIKPAWSKDDSDLLQPQYIHILEAYTKGKNGFKVYYQAVVEKCSEIIRTDFVVNKNQATQLELGCNITLKAYYGLESKGKPIKFKLLKGRIK